ncbi:MAG: acyl-[acyl-carrier-protein]--UDP-N-acetylglucosamine O-acyltransferase, partial [Rickettsiaceae bacterium]|nr:acyl-[acyl-carrier-protein]--UDP-N-acetylglucosamine O-acyltransferase [Rickettsiaceae bacterium]
MIVIHETAIVSSSASIGKNVKIGPFSIIGPNVTLGDNVEVKSHVVIEGRTTIGEDTVIYPFASIGQIPQILRRCDDAAEVVIGKRNRIREYVTIQSGTSEGIMLTKVGDDNLFMVGVHIAHD